MKKNNKSVEKIKKDFLLKLKGYLKGLESLCVIKAEKADFQRKSFGWSLYLSYHESQHYLSIVKPKFRSDLSHENFICFTESLGLLEINIQEKGLCETYERECHQRLPESGQLRAYFKSINDVIKQEGEFSNLKTQGLVCILCTLFAELVFDAPHLDYYMSDSRRQMMIKINSSVSGKVGSSFSAQNIAEDLGYSIQHLNKVSQLFRGMSLNNYINFYKLEGFRSKLLLSREKISKLTADCGFRDVNYLIQLFKKTYNITPLQLRKRLQNSTFEESRSLHQTMGFELLSPIGLPKNIGELSVKDKRCTLVVGNLTNELLELYWISPEKEEVPMGLIAGWDRIHLGSAEGHCWLLRKGREEAYFKAGKKNCLMLF